MGPGVTESVLNFGPASELVGTLTEPAGRADPSLAVVIVNAGIIHRAGPNRVHVRIARRMADAGMLSFRIDMAGIGDSDGLGTNESVDEECVLSITAALDLLEDRGRATRFVLFGLCAGADYALQHAGRDRRVVGVASVDPPTMPASWKAHLIRGLRAARRPSVWYRLVTGRYGLMRRLLTGRLRASTPNQSGSAREQARSALRHLVERDVRMLLLITGNVKERYNYAGQLFDLYPGIGLERVVRVALRPSASHTFGREADKMALTRDLLGWLKETSFARPALVDAGADHRQEGP